MNLIKSNQIKYTDRKRKASENIISHGDKVYVKNMEKPNKLCANFNSTPHTVEASKGGDVMVRNDKTGQVFRKNVVHLKKVEVHGQFKIM